MSNRVMAFAALLVVTMTFSGCIGDDPVPQQDEEVEDEGPQARATSSTGSLSGRVFTFSLLELEGATVELAKDAEPLYTATTSANGTFVINKIVPGEYFVSFSADGFRNATKSITIRASQVTEVDIRLPDLSDTEAKVPYVVRDDLVGMIGCGVGNRNEAFQITWSICSFDENNRETFPIHVQPGLQELVVGLTWEPVGGMTGRALDLLIRSPDCGIEWNDTVCYKWVGGEPDIIVNLTDGVIHPNLHFANITEETEIELFVAPPTEDMPDVLYQQEFHLYYEAYYYQNAPEGRNPIGDR